jgi:shikimate kinase
MKKFKNIVIIGMRGSGKSHFGSCLSQEFGFPKIDTDEEIETITQKTIPAIIKTEGWESFRKKEEQVIQRACKIENSIISTGGGAILSQKNQEQIKKDSLIIFLFASLDELLERLENDSSRPPLTSEASLKDEITKVWKERGEIYFSLADIVFRAQENLSESKRKNVEINAKILANKIKQLFF